MTTTAQGHPIRARQAFTPPLCRAARGLLGWTQGDLARRASIEPEAVELFEAAEADLGGVDLMRLGEAFYAGGVIAVQAKLAGAGVRFAKVSASGDVAR